MKKIADYLKNDFNKVIDRAIELGFEKNISEIKQKLHNFEGVVLFDKKKIIFKPLGWAGTVDDLFKATKGKDKYIVNTAHDVQKNQLRQYVDKGIHGYLFDMDNLTAPQKKALDEAVEQNILQKKPLSMSEIKEIDMSHVDKIIAYWKHGKPFNLKDVEGYFKL